MARYIARLRLACRKRNRHLVATCALIVCFLVLAMVHMNQMESDELLRERKYQAHEKARMGLSKKNKSDRTRNVAFEKIIHLDLKGAPPKLSYFRKVLPLLKEWGATGLLVEYEDTFPYDGRLFSLPRRHAYTKVEVQELQHLAKTLGLLFIPLVQTFGHLEFVLKHGEFAHLRELPEDSSCIAAGPCMQESFDVLTEIVRQIMLAHPGVAYIHLGSDEVWQLGKGIACTQYMEGKSLTKPELFLQHMTYIASFVRKNFPNVTPIVWDDMFRTTDINLLEGYNVGELVEPMVWRYKQDVEERFGENLWKKYAQIFKHAWVGSAFKGATGETQAVANIRYYSENVLHWRNIVEREKHRMHFKGMVLTGWTRYNHIKAICELLPASLPSAAFCLKMAQDGEISPSATRTISASLGCGDHIIDPHRDPLPSKIRYNCTFPGFDVYEDVFEYRHLLTFLRKRKGARSVSLQIPHGEFKDKAEGVRDRLEKHLAVYFDEDTVAEWIRQNIHPLLTLKAVSSRGEGQEKKR